MAKENKYEIKRNTRQSSTKTNKVKPKKKKYVINQSKPKAYDQNNKEITIFYRNILAYFLDFELCDPCCPKLGSCFHNTVTVISSSEPPPLVLAP